VFGSANSNLCEL